MSGSNNIATYMSRVNTRISKLVTNIPSSTTDPIGHDAGTWFAASGGNQPGAVITWASAEFYKTQVQVSATNPTNNWNLWQNELRVNRIVLFAAGPRPPDPDGRAWDWFNNQGGPGSVGFVGDAPPEVIDWVVAHLPIIVFPNFPELRPVVVLT